MKYEIIELEEKYIEGIDCKTTNIEGQALKDIGSTWQRFFENGYYEKLENKVNGKTIGLYTDYEGDYTKPYRFIAGAEVRIPSLDGKNVTRMIPRGKYAKFIVVGGPKAVGELWNQIWAMSIPRSYTFDFEEYQDQLDSEQEVHIYIALQ